MKKKYDEIIKQHYSKVAKEHGLSSSSTMVDEITRNMETDAIIKFVGESLTRFKKGNPSEKAVIMDVGCGNGYTLEVLLGKFPGHKFVGIEYSDELRALATSRFRGIKSVKIQKGDIRKKDFTEGISADILICQRVLINLLDIKDQKYALTNIASAVKSPGAQTAGGTLLFIECFINSLARLNEARREFELEDIQMAYHNHYLPDNFFKVPQLMPLRTDAQLPPPNFLSTRYYVTRVFHAIFTKNKTNIKRNSEFVNFFTQALNQNAGDYSPLKLFMFEKTGKG